MKYDPGMYDEILPSALVIVDWRLVDQLRDATIRVVQSGASGVLILLDRSTLVSKARLLTVNMCLRTMWSSMAVIVKPWTDRISVDRTEDGSLPTSTIPGITEELNTATSKLDKLLRSANKLIFIHGTGELVTQGPPAPPTPNLEIAMSTEVDTYLCAVLEAETVDGAAALWRPGPSKPGQHKRLQQQPKHSKGNRGYSRGCGGFKGRGSGG